MFTKSLETLKEWDLGWQTREAPRIPKMDLATNLLFLRPVLQLQLPLKTQEFVENGNYNPASTKPQFPQSSFQTETAKKQSGIWQMLSLLPSKSYKCIQVTELIHIHNWRKVWRLELLAFHTLPLEGWWHGICKHHV